MERTAKYNGFDLFVPHCDQSLVDWLVSRPKKSIKKGKVKHNVLWNEQQPTHPPFFKKNQE